MVKLGVRRGSALCVVRCAKGKFLTRSHGDTERREENGEVLRVKWELKFNFISFLKLSVNWSSLVVKFPISLRASA